MGIDRPGGDSETGCDRVFHPDLSATGKPLSGLRGLIPGYSQWWWGQRERGFVLFGSYVAALAMASFLWGTLPGLALLLFAYLTHTASTCDMLAQESFPPRGGAARGLGVSVGLGVGFYLPILAWLTLVAWPSLRDGSRFDGYLVNCRAYRQSEPQRDEWICYRATPKGEARVGRVVAVDGQEVEWSLNSLRVNGGRVEGLREPFRGSRIPQRLSYKIPRGHFLINPRDRPSADGVGEGLVLVSRGEIVGRAWARLYPIRERRLLLTGPRAAPSQES